MKRLLILFFIAAYATSCTDIIDIYPVENMSSDQFFENEVEVNQAVAGMYSRLGRNGTNDDLPSILYLMLSESRSDNWFMATAPNAQRDQADIRRFQVQTSNGWVSAGFNRLYTLIADANLIIESVDEDTYRRQRAEAHFLRAYAYFELVRTWGDVPLVLKPIARHEALTYERTPSTDVYAQVIEDLQYAIANLDDMPTGEDAGHAGAWAARTLLAYAYCTMAGYPLNDGTAYQKAVDVLSPIINNLSGRFAPNYADIFDIDQEDTWDLFSVQFQSGNAGLGSSLPGYEVGGGSSTATMYPEWAYSGYTVQGQDFRVDNGLVDDMLLEGDQRADFPILTEGYNSVDKDGNLEWVSKPYLLIKYLVRDNTNNVIKAWNDYPLNCPILRVSDAYLLYAEALIGVTRASEALPWINLVRTRAGIQPLTGTPTLADVMDERRKEFIGEGKRYFDLVRQGETVFLSSLRTFLDDNNQVSTEYGASYPTARDMLLPIPYSTITINTDWDQNSGY
ncbi:MAG: RagB/SusD family nutrient uptake outer membrane protein [Rikenellaceae bacterium]|nr:RagB/SusD family nutrient uptake outer membrane protein [Rikenellaceae bacterium]